jgi:hypothetical protein
MLRSWREKFMRPGFLSLIIAVCLLGASAISPTARLMAQSPPHTEGQCDGAMRGFDGREYPCGPHRKPACDPSGARCVCVERVECGGRTNEPY